jgi:hypothetical protein
MSQRYFEILGLPLGFHRSRAKGFSKCVRNILTYKIVKGIIKFYFQNQSKIAEIQLMLFRLFQISNVN